MKISAEDVRLIRNVYGYTRKQFAQHLNVSKTYIYLVETGRKPISEPLEDKIAKRFIEDENMLIAIRLVGKQFAELRKQVGDKDA
ncbi:helix-turn-helix transcriptional regulator [Priestia aryabhattai]|uniref:helix-turn-helix domain-containing protein n=1 Tax=Priestia aryabhattai TaxID=412384 RepID=UPI003D2DBA20